MVIIVAIIVCGAQAPASLRASRAFKDATNTWIREHSALTYDVSSRMGLLQVGGGADAADRGASCFKLLDLRPHAPFCEAQFRPVTMGSVNLSERILPYGAVIRERCCELQVSVTTHS